LAEYSKTAKRIKKMCHFFELSFFFILFSFFPAKKMAPLTDHHPGVLIFYAFFCMGFGLLLVWQDEKFWRMMAKMASGAPVSPAEKPAAAAVGLSSLLFGVYALFFVVKKPHPRPLRRSQHRA